MQFHNKGMVNKEYASAVVLPFPHIKRNMEQSLFFKLSYVVA